MYQNNNREDLSSAPVPAVSPELDMLSCDLLESALDALAAEKEIPVIVSLEDVDGNRVTQLFSDDGIEVCLEAAHSYITSLATTTSTEELTEPLASAPVRYALVYMGAVVPEESDALAASITSASADANSAYEDALILEFAEKGKRAFSAYVLWQGCGQKEAFCWSDPQPAGEIPSLLS